MKCYCTLWFNITLRKLGEVVNFDLDIFTLFYKKNALYINEMKGAFTCHTTLNLMTRT